MTRQFLSQMSLFDLKDRLVEHGDLLSELKRVQEGLVGGFERELTTPNTLLITGSGVRVPHHPLTKVSPRSEQSAKSSNP
jgi:hypothetical protein